MSIKSLQGRVWSIEKTVFRIYILFVLVDLVVSVFKYCTLCTIYIIIIIISATVLAGHMNWPSWSVPFYLLRYMTAAGMCDATVIIIMRCRVDVQSARPDYHLAHHCCHRRTPAVKNVSSYYTNWFRCWRNKASWSSTCSCYNPGTQRVAFTVSMINKAQRESLKVDYSSLE